MDLASLRLRIPLHRIPVPADEEAQLRRLIDDLTPFDGAMPTGSFNQGVAGAMADLPGFAAALRRCRADGTAR